MMPEDVCDKSCFSTTEETSLTHLNVQGKGWFIWMGMWLCNGRRDGSQNRECRRKLITSTSENRIGQMDWKQEQAKMLEVQSCW